jgi:hypothetical protein
MHGNSLLRKVLILLGIGVGLAVAQPAFAQALGDADCPGGYYYAPGYDVCFPYGYDPAYGYDPGYAYAPPLYEPFDLFLDGRRNHERGPAREGHAVHGAGDRRR